jgi:uncharacterized protein (TIGR02145 family)
LFFGVVVVSAFSLAFGNAGSFTDSRDGQTYRTVRIGDLTWMAQNLNFTTDDSWCYDDDASNCERYGRLYTWDAAMTACPAGWRLPTRRGWIKLERVAGGSSVAGRNLKSQTGWLSVDGNDGDGADDFGFSALPGGYRYSDGNFYNVGGGGYWWGATENGSGNAWFRGMSSSHERVVEFSGIKGNGFSVLCLQE